MNGRHKRALEFRAKAEKWLRWSRSSLAEMRNHGEAIRMDDVDRAFTVLLFQIATTHEALSSAATCANLTDWAQQLDAHRNNDQLLLYLWKARDTETHDALVKWTPDTNSARIEVVDELLVDAVTKQFYSDQSEGARLNRLLEFLYEAQGNDAISKRMTARHRPSPERQAQAGVKLHHLESLTLGSFTTKDKKGKVLQIRRPSLHMAKEFEPTAHGAAKTAIGYYESKLGELSALLDPPRA